MLKKLLKQEWKSFFPAPTITMIILAAVTLILMSTFMTSFWEESSNIFADLFASLTIMAYIFCLAALSLCVTICTAIRFYKNLFTDEGYLMFTLPVKTSDLLLSKALVSVFWKLISIIFTVLSILGIASVGIAYLSDTSIIQFFQEFSEVFQELLAELRETLAIPISLFILWLLIIGICSLFFSTLFIYTCICLGQFWSKHKIGGAIIAYFGLRFVFNIFKRIFTIPVINFFDTDNLSTGGWILLMFVSLVIMGGLCAALYCACNYIMSKKLNLD
ncbi:MAG: hypothetical protein HDQ96_00175 [Lachnospiraceae bacterium]|nr:hypothetical protein [Lachnospiraceae bacterium]